MENKTSENQKCVTVIFNPVSGKGDPETRKKLISEALAEHGYTCQFIATSPEEGADALAKKALADGVDLVVVSGGDGTVMEVMSALVGTDVPLAVIPAGTGNLLSINLGIPAEVPDAIHVALSGQPYALDLARTDDGKYFAIMGGLGMDAQIISDAGREAKNRLGVLAYFLSALKNLRRRRARFEIHLDDDRRLRRRAKTVMIANMGRITGGLEAIPAASPDDGLLDVAILKTETLGQWLRLLGYALRGHADRDPDFEIHQARRIVIHSPMPEPAEFDGEEGGRTARLHVEVVPKAVRILLPEDAPAAHAWRHDAPPAAVTAPVRRLALIPVLLVLVAGGLWFLKRRRAR